VIAVCVLVVQVFGSLIERSQHSTVQDWVMLSLSNFTQRTPAASAVWSLTCFFISASTNTWIRALYPSHASTWMLFF
jgi:huntingtin